MAATRIDCDIHPAVGGTRTTLLPYLDDHWKEQVVSRAIDGLDLTSYPPNMPLSGRSDWRPAKGKPGTVLRVDKHGILVAAKVGGLLLREVQLEGKKRMHAAEFARGFNLPVGLVLE